jgi:hypothetical protein
VSAERINVDAVDFQIACRRFTVRATVTRDRQLGVVDEYVLRLLAVVERMPITRLRAWFGFSEAEMETVLLDMGERRSWIEFDGDDVVLSPAGRDLFRTVGDDGIPQIVEVAPLVADVWFDLVSRNMVPRSRPYNVDYLVRLREQESARELPEAFAREAFESNFRQYARRIRRFPDADSVNLYSISDVHGGGYAYQVLPAGLALDLEKLTVRPVFPDLDDGGPGFQKLTVAANDAWMVLNAPDAAATTAVEFDRMTGQSHLAPLIRAPDSRRAWYDALSLQRAPGFLPTIGAAYLEGNVTALLDAVSTAGELPSPMEVVWLRPSGTSWGRTLRVADTLQAIRETLRNAGVAEVSTRLAMPRSTHRSVRTNHRRLFDFGVLSPQGHLPANLEVLLVGGVAALVNVHLPVTGHGVGIGGVVTDQKRLSRIAERLRVDQQGSWDVLWPVANSQRRPTKRPQAKRDANGDSSLAT